MGWERERKGRDRTEKDMAGVVTRFKEKKNLPPTFQEKKKGKQGLMRP